MDVAVTVGLDHRRRRKGSSGHVVAQLLESPLPTPRRSCCGRAADASPASRRGRADASPQRGHVPFKWESSPGVPKSAACAGGGGKEREVPLLPKPPPGRCGGPCRARAYHHSNTTDSSSGHDDDTFSEALDRISSSDRLAALSARLSAIDGVFGSRRSPSFIMDRFLPAANAIATTSADKHPRRRSPLLRSKSRHAKDAEAPARARHDVAHIRRRALAREQPKHTLPRQCTDAAAAQAQPPPRVNEDAQGDRMTPRACGFMFFVPWSAKPVLLGFQRSPARSRTPRADVVSAAASSPPRRSITLGDVLEKERKLRDSGLSRWHDEKSGSGKEWSNPGWGMALLGTSKRYCADARKALSRLTRSGTDGGDSPRIGRERRSGKPGASMLRSMSVKMPPLSPPSESWLTNARRSNAGNNRR
ncbi:hypothetical protein SETIT_3G209200v2 [Setaria italica]|uniref:Uncharacterized protein n=1 Tax=Setaria italica TaxID=4555 RepID=K3Z6J1_SETIT|nr:hypothetical protein SETIT_3G209200v2 [Setaria italica]